MFLFYTEGEVCSYSTISYDIIIIIHVFFILVYILLIKCLHIQLNLFLCASISTMFLYYTKAKFSNNIYIFISFIKIYAINDNIFIAEEQGQTVHKTVLHFQVQTKLLRVADLRTYRPMDTGNFRNSCAS